VRADYLQMKSGNSEWRDCC